MLELWVNLIVFAESKFGWHQQKTQNSYEANHSHNLRNLSSQRSLLHFWLAENEQASNSQLQDWLRNDHHRLVEDHALEQLLG